jgi:NTE family protein
MNSLRRGVSQELVMHYRNFVRLAPLFLISLATSVVAQAPDPASVVSRDTRPSIGLVLSGGGARGGAHVGVLRALEELGVPVDVIAGTSIGAIIGGFYASGMSADEIESVIGTIDWDAAFIEDAPRDLIAFRRKRDHDLFLVDEKPGLNDGELELPLGVVQGQVIDLILTEQTLPVAHIDNFDQLPIPFRAIATDITSGESVILSSGNLAAAIRASMSVPAVISPIEIDGRLLVDGGVSMNLPIEVAQQMGADVVIAVDVGSPMLARDELTSVLSITEQLTNLLMKRGVDEQLRNMREDDLLIVPEFEEHLNSAGFSQMGETIAIGYAAAMAHMQTLAAYAVDEADYVAYQASVAGPEQPIAPTIDFLRLRNNSSISDAIIERHLRGIAIGQPLDVAAVEDAVNRVYGMELYQNVRYILVTQGEQTGLEFQLDERSWGPNYVQMGLQFSAAGDENVMFGLSASYLSTQINEHNGEWRATATLGDEPALRTTFHQPFGREGQYFFQPSFRLESEIYNVFENSQRVAELQLREAALEFAVGRELATWGEIRAGVRSSSGSFNFEVGDPTLVPSEDYDEGEIFARFSVDTLDDRAFPRSGGIAALEWRGSRPEQLGADVDFDQVSLSGSYAKSWDRYTLLTRLRYDATTSGTAPVNGLYRLGGFLDLSGLNQNELSGQNAARVGAILYRRINNLAFLPAFAGVSLEVGNVWEHRSEMSAGSSLVGGSIWVGVETPVGPIYAGYGRAESNGGAVYVFLGQPF